MKVTEKDLIGDIKDFPIEVVQRMVDCQVEQGNDAKLSNIKNDRIDGGFNWSETKEGHSFWWDVIINKKFDLFFVLPEKVTLKENGIEISGVELSIEELEIILNELKNK